MKTLSLIAISFIFIGCTKEPNVGYITQGYNTCECSDTDNITYNIKTKECVCGGNNGIIIKETIIKDDTFGIKKELVDSNECPTEVTERFYSKASGWITVCKGKFLENGAKTRIVTIKK